MFRRLIVAPGCGHAAGWVVIAAIMFAQPFGLIAADTKHDLVANPGGFLAEALSAYTDTFTLGQLQNQAWGYLFPQGLFFWAADPLPDWVAQRLWWTIVVGTGYSGMLALLRLIGVSSPAARIAGALVFALSPRVLTTLTAISSETWPVMLSAWVLVALVGLRGWRAGLAATIPVALMGAVNAAATLAALTPGAVYLVVQLCTAARGRERTGAVQAAASWAGGTIAVSVWWAVPLVILGRYSPPFTEFIESAAVTTRWLNPAEIIRGTTSWTPFVDVERQAGFLLVSEPVLVLATLFVALIGLIGLSLLGPRRAGAWWLMLGLGLVILGAGFGPLAGGYLELLDGPLAAFRNLHKFDPLVRIPLAIGVANAVAWLSARRRPATLAVLVLVAGVIAASISPALSGRLLPRGAYLEVPEYWRQAAAAAGALDTRTLIVPPATFARQTWGWTRDEPLQPLATAPWATRDAVPLVNPEAVRGLDGALAALLDSPREAAGALRGLGIGALLVRHDLDDAAARDTAARLSAELPGKKLSFGPQGEVELHVLDPQAGMRLATRPPVTVAGGGEAIGVLGSIFGAQPFQLVEAGEPAQIVTDTPQLTARNFGAGFGGQSAALTSPGEGADVRNRLLDYPSRGAAVTVAEHGGRVRASSSAADATNFGGPRQKHSVTSAVDGLAATSWRPQLGRGAGEFLELSADNAPHNPMVRITADTDTELVMRAGDARAVRIKVQAMRPRSVRLPGSGPVRIELTEPAGIAEAAIKGHPIERIITVPEASPSARAFLFQRLAPDQGPIRREFTVPAALTVQVHTPGAQEVVIDSRALAPGETVELSPGTHRVLFYAAWLSLVQPDFAAELAEGPGSVPLGGGTEAQARAGVRVDAAGQPRILMTGRAANPGLRAELDGTPLEPITVGAGIQGFQVPAHAQGTVHFSFAGDRAYRVGLGAGAAIGVVALGLCLYAVATARRRTGSTPAGSALAASTPPDSTLPGSTPLGTLSRRARWVPFGALTAAGVICAGGAGALAAAAAYAVTRWTKIHPRVLATACLITAAAWLARAPWPPQALYAGDSALLAGAVLTGVIACAVPAMPPASQRLSRGPLDQHVAAPGHRDRAEGGQTKNYQEVPGKRPDSRKRQGDRQDGEVPQEDRVAPPA